MPRRLLTPVVLVTALVLVSARSATAASCVPGTLQAYINAGSCDIAGAIFSDWGLFPTPAAATPINPNQVQVTPIAGGGQMGFLFGLSVDASFDEFFDVAFHYSVSGNSLFTFSAAHLDMANATATDTGNVTAIEDICVGGSFNPGTVSGCPGAQFTNIVFQLDGLNDLTESAFFTKNGFLDIVNDIGIDAGGAGTASLGQVRNLFDVQAVPEPTTGLLIATGLGVILRRARRPRSS